ncbi:hypothetical protein ACFP8W_06995 [Nocardioides hankookensis]|uniref:Uncharacterized protein n=1 Tax=Nocardioides hankookensis TaxID=443157 RepID=A0ABW1LEB0_9ACTN
MLRKLMAVLAALAVATGLTVAVTAITSGADAKAVLPAHGNYSGVDHAGRVVTFSFSGNYMSHLTINHHTIGGAHVAGAAWHETCHNGFCTRGTWTTDTHVAGSWRTGGGHWTHFSASVVPSLRPYAGPYMGRDHTGLAIHLTYGSSMIHGFKLDHSVRGNIAVHNAKFDTCLSSICVKGHWQSDYEVVGSWRPVHGSHWVSFEAYAYAP